MDCPFEDCPAARQHLSPQTLIRHLGRIHVSGGQGVPPAVLKQLGHYVCVACRHLVRISQPCSFCRRTEQTDMDLEDEVGRPIPPTPLQPLAGTPINLPCPLLSPDIDTVLMSRIPTFRHIPTACRPAFARTLGVLLQSVALSPT